MALLEKTLYDDDFLVWCPLSMDDQYVNDKCSNTSKGNCVYFVSKKVIDNNNMEMECSHPDFKNGNY